MTSEQREMFESNPLVKPLKCFCIATVLWVVSLGLLQDCGVSTPSMRFGTWGGFFLFTYCFSFLVTARKKRE